MPVDYAGIASEVSEAFVEVSQGTVTLTRSTPGTPNPAEPWVAVAATTETFSLDATVKAVEDNYVNGSTILATDDMVTASAIMTKTHIDGVAVANEIVALEVLPGDLLSIDGDVVTIVKTQRVPGAGIAVLWKLIVRS